MKKRIALLLLAALLLGLTACGAAGAVNPAASPAAPVKIFWKRRKIAWK